MMNDGDRLRIYVIVLDEIAFGCRRNRNHVARGTGAPASGQVQHPSLAGRMGVWLGQIPEVVDRDDRPGMHRGDDMSRNEQHPRRPPEHLPREPRMRPESGKRNTNRVSRSREPGRRFHRIEIELDGIVDAELRHRREELPRVRLGASQALDRPTACVDPDSARPRQGNRLTRCWWDREHEFSTARDLTVHGRGAGSRADTTPELAELDLDP